MFGKWFATAALAASTTFAGSALAYQPLEKDPKTINFGIISTESTMALREQWMPLIEDMEEALGADVEPFFATDYSGIIEGMRFAKVHVAWYGNKSAMEAVDRAGGEIFAQTTDLDGKRGYYSVIVTRKDSGIDSLDELLVCDESLDFGNGDPNSTSGYLVPGYYVFAKRDINPRQCFGTVTNASHGANLVSVATGTADAATNNNESLARFRERRPNMAAQLQVIWKSPMIPSDPMVYREDLSESLKARIQGFFLTYARVGDNIEAEREVLANIGPGMGPFIDSNDTQLYPIRELELFKRLTEIKNDTSLDDAQREAKLAAINAKLERLAVWAQAEVATDAPQPRKVANAE